MNPIYKPQGRALEYSPDALALNIYTGCPHGCTYCFAPKVLRKSRKDFHSKVLPRKGIDYAVKRQLDRGYVDYTVYVDNPDDPAGYLTGKAKIPEKRRIELKNKLIHLCFTCDPYPNGYASTATRDIIKLIKDSGNHVQILTKNSLDAERDFDLLDDDDWFGVTITGGWTVAEYEPMARPPMARLLTLGEAHRKGINTWVSCEPVLIPEAIYNLITDHEYIDLYRIGKMNYEPSDIDWGVFGRECERLCIEHNRNYYIKNDLRKEMGK